MRRKRRSPRLAAVAALAALSSLAGGCASARRLVIPRRDERIAVDGVLDEACWRGAPLVSDFRVASEPTRRAAATKAWLCWSPERLAFAFECEDAQIVAAPESGREHDVDLQDRVELFLWSGRAEDSYACIEIGARGAVHDYRARFHRVFDDAWSARGLEQAARATSNGYVVEATLPRATLAELGFALEAGTRLRVGLFRAEFPSSAAAEPASPTWITWIDAGLEQPDFHVPASFGEAELGAATSGG